MNTQIFINIWGEHNVENNGKVIYKENFLVIFQKQSHTFFITTYFWKPTQNL